MTLPSLRRNRYQLAADAVIARAIAVFVVAMAAQSAGPAMSQLPALAAWWTGVIGVCLLGFGGWMVASSVRGRTRRAALTGFAAAVGAGLLLWPAAHPDALSGDPWIWNILGLAVVCVAAAWGQLVALLYTGLVAADLVLVRTLPSGGAAGWQASLQDALYLVMAGAALTAAVQAMRLGAQRADASVEAAAEAHRASSAARARLMERHRLGAIMHDTVLAALVSAARATVPAERAAAARLAREGLRQLGDLDSGDPSTALDLRELPTRIQAAADAGATLPVRIYAQAWSGVTGQVPGPVAEAVLAAVGAAVDNAGRHSGSDQVTIRMGVTRPPERLRVEVADRGRGFDPASVPERCLGIRLSITQRLADVGGSAVIESRPGGGTRILLDCQVQAP